MEPRQVILANTEAIEAIVISAPGSYYLGENVTAIPDNNAITITADNVTLDLNGFTVSKPNLEKPGRLHLVVTAWSENAGWIVSHCLATNSCDENSFGLQVETATGLVQGSAWSENLGWLSFSCENTSSCAAVNFGLQFDPDALTLDDLFKDGFESGP